jgi:hypothetical protein
LEIFLKIVVVPNKFSGGANCFAYNAQTYNFDELGDAPSLIMRAKPVIIKPGGELFVRLNTESFPVRDYRTLWVSLEDRQELFDLIKIDDIMNSTAVYIGSENPAEEEVTISMSAVIKVKELIPDAPIIVNPVII